MYTEGGWKVAEKDNFDTIIRDAMDIKIARVGFSVNAKLIVSSPRMANLLERLVNDGWNASISEEAKEILQSVEGE